MPAPPADMKVRAATPPDAEPLLRVLCAAFGLDREAARPLFYQDPYYDLARKWALETPQDGIVACLTIIPATLVVRGVPLQTGGIAGVATLPAYQGRGYASHLLAQTVRALADERVFPISALFPYSEAFYRRLGWETAARARRWAGTLLPSSQDALGGPVRAASLQDPHDRELLRGLRAALPTEQTGLCRRDAKRWRVLEMTTHAWEWRLAETHGLCEGYVALERPAGMDDPVIIHEMAAATDNARRGLVTFLSREFEGRAGLVWATSAAQPAAFGLPASGNCRPVEPGMMLRLTDLAAVLRALHPVLAPSLARAHRTLTIAATDALRPQNNALLRLTPHGVEPGTAHDPDRLHASIGALAPLITGDCLPSGLAAQGQLWASLPSALALADELFPLTHPFVAPADQF